jgi:hypothetical protein
VPTSKRPQIDNVQYPRIPSEILKGASNEKVVNDVVADEIIWIFERMECRDT